MTTNALATQPKLYRSSIARGLSDSRGAVYRTGGDFNQGVIYGTAVITRGEALGHDAWIDADMLGQVAEAINLSEKGTKARFTHPSMSGDGMGKYLGRFRNGVLDGDVVRADLHFAEAGHKTPDGDLASYVMDMAEEDPEAFGISISFEHDSEAMAAFASDYADENGGFVSPDINNDRNLPHVRLSKLRAADAVDDPAANPAGLFQRDGDVPRNADRLLSYAFGLDGADSPGTQFNINPDRARGFAQRWLDQHGITLTSKDIAMSDDNTELNADDTTAAEPIEAGEPVDEPVEDTAAVEPAEPAADAPAELSTGQRFLDAFGDQGGVWFAQGKTFEEATQLHIEALSARNAELEAKVARQSEDRGGDAIDLNAADTKPGKSFAEFTNPSK